MYKSQNWHFVCISTWGSSSSQFTWFIIVWSWWKFMPGYPRMKTAKPADPEPKPLQDLLWSGKNSAVYYSPLFKRYYRLYCALERFINNKLRRSRDHLLIICITEAPDCLINMKRWVMFCLCSLMAMMVVGHVLLWLTHQIGCTVNTHCTSAIHTSSVKKCEVSKWSIS